MKWKTFNFHFDENTQTYVMLTLPLKEFRVSTKGLKAKESIEKPINFSIIPRRNTVNIFLLVPKAKEAEKIETFEISWHVSINYR